MTSTRINSVMERAGEAPEVVLEATYGWYWAVDALAAAGAHVHLAHPLGVKAFEYRRVKNDLRDATDLADLLRMGRLPEAWIAPPKTRELRELVRHRAKLVGLRSHCKAEIHAVLARCGIQVLMSDLFGPAGQDLLVRCPLPGPYGARVQSLLRLIEALDIEIDRFAGLTRGRLTANADYVALQQIPGIGPILGAVFFGRSRRCDQVQQRDAAAVLGRPDAQAPRVRHQGPPGPYHQAGLPAGPVGRSRVGEVAGSQDRGRCLQATGR
jgi:transposase